MAHSPDIRKQRRETGAGSGPVKDSAAGMDVHKHTHRLSSILQLKFMGLFLWKKYKLNWNLVVSNQLLTQFQNPDLYDEDFKYTQYLLWFHALLLINKSLLKLNEM